MRPARHIEPAFEDRLIDAVVLEGKVPIPAPIAGELRAKEVAAPIRFEPESGATSNAASECVSVSVASTLSVKIVPISAW